MRPFVMSRGLRGCVEYGSIEYSAVSQPPVTPCSFIQRGTPSSIVTAHTTRVLPIETSTEPLACGATFNSKWSGRISSGPRPSLRCIVGNLDGAGICATKILQCAEEARQKRRIPDELYCLIGLTHWAAHRCLSVRVKNSAHTQTAVCIAGAHRSGTSMLTSLLHACGLYLGPENALMPPQTDNPEGFWEHLGFVALNDELLNGLGGAWDLPPRIDENFKDSRLDPLRMKAKLLIEGFDSARVWGWKDPRNSLTLPFWLNVLPGLKTLIMVRNPLEAAHSMRERNGTSYSFGLRLWEIYNRRVIEAVDEKDRLVTHYDSFFRDAESELRRIVRFVGLPDTEVCNAAALVSRRRHHTHFTLDALIDRGASAETIGLAR